MHRAQMERTEHPEPMALMDHQAFQDHRVLQVRLDRLGLQEELDQRVRQEMLDPQVPTGVQVQLVPRVLPARMGKLEAWVQWDPLVQPVSLENLEPKDQLVFPAPLGYLDLLEHLDHRVRRVRLVHKGLLDPQVRLDLMVNLEWMVSVVHLV